MFHCICFSGQRSIVRRLHPSEAYLLEELVTLTTQNNQHLCFRVPVQKGFKGGDIKRARMERDALSEQEALNILFRDETTWPWASALGLDNSCSFQRYWETHPDYKATYLWRVAIYELRVLDILGNLYLISQK